MRIVLDIVQEMVLVLLIAEVLAAVLALPLWWLFGVFNPGPAWIPTTYWEAWVVTSTLVVGICVVIWVAEMTKGVNL